MQKDFPRIVFVGAHMEARRPFEHLISSSERIAGLFTLEPEGLARMSGGTDLTQAAQVARIPVKRGRSVNDPETAAWIRQLAPDLLLVIGWTQLVKSELLGVPRVGALGFHASLLPKYRGRAPVNWALLNGESETGNTLLVLEPGADEGDIVCQRRIPITDNDDCRTIYEKVSLTECEMLDEILPLVRQGRLPRIKQDSREATAMPKRRPEDGLIDWSWTSKRLYDWVRALTHPYPGAFSHLSGQKITIWKASVATHAQQSPPGVIALDSDGYPLVGTQDGHLKLWQLEHDGSPSVTGFEAAETFLKPPVCFQPAAARHWGG
jgi:methionyl-tRNA formyltransferase